MIEKMRALTAVLISGLMTSAAAGAGASLAQPPDAHRSPAGAPAAAVSTPPVIPAEVFFKPAALHEVRLSPSGRRLALSRPGGNGRLGVFVIDLQASDFQATRAILFSDGDVPAFEWVNDERLVFSVTDEQAGLAEDAYQAPGLFAVRYDGTELRDLVETRGRPLVTNADRVHTLPWNHWLLHVPTPPEETSGARSHEVVIGELHFSGRELASISPMWLDTRTGRTRSMGLERAPCPALQWWFNAPGEPRAALCRRQGRETLIWYTPSQGDQPGRWTPLAEGPAGQLDFVPLWVGQGQQLYVRHVAGAAGEAVVAPFDFERNAPGSTLVEAPGFDFSGQLLGDRQGQRLLGVRISTDAEQTIWFDPALQAAQARADAALPGRVNRLSCRRCGSDDAVMLVRSFSDQDPGQLLLWRQADNSGQGRWQRVGLLRPDVQPQAMARTDLERIRARDGRDLPVWLTRPTGAAGARPAVVLVHGGPWVRGRHWNWQDLPQFLASRGYLVIEPEFRGSDGYGRDHLRAGFRQWGQAMQDDVADALLWARQQGLASEAACIVGGSFGGYSTLMGLIRHPELYRCGSAWVAVTDPFLYLEGSWRVRDDISDSGRRYSLPQMVGDVEKDREMLLAHSPLAQAHRIRAPLQLVWGRQDLRVPIVHGRRLLDAMNQAGRQPEWVVFEGEAHGWRKTEHKLAFALKLESFLARHLLHPAGGR